MTGMCIVQGQGSDKAKEMLIVLMGVCGCGKTTVGEAVADSTGWGYWDADDFHPESNKSKMKNSLPLNDEDRVPWLLAIHRHLKSLQEAGSSGIVSCSSLKACYRNILRTGHTGSLLGDHNSGADLKGERCSAPNTTNQGNNESLNGHSKDKEDGVVSLDLVFVHLNGSEGVLQGRLEARRGHFMPPALLQSQLETLEPLLQWEAGLTVDVDQPHQDTVREILQKLGQT
ncbi:probable gluconokinase isoform X1 [Mya arenaria]|uniref:probable gluconokinase isoform X1 n=2 Tax=Mya arenaria TaxID=6604 RepID=UPI0022E6704C|nr:probable gluconokinase isoform X1 [Mya arenaria]